MKISELIIREENDPIAALKTTVSDALKLADQENRFIGKTKISQLPTVRRIAQDAGWTDNETLNKVTNILRHPEFKNRKKIEKHPDSPELIRAIENALKLRTADGKLLGPQAIAQLPSVISVMPPDLTYDAIVNKVKHVRRTHFANSKVRNLHSQELITAVSQALETPEGKLRGPLEISRLNSVRRYMPAHLTDQQMHDKVTNILQLPQFKDRKKLLNPITEKEIKYAKEQFVNGVFISIIAQSLERAYGTIKNALKVLPNFYTELIQKHEANRPKDPTTSAAERLLFDLLTKSGVRDIQRNVKIAREGRFYYNIDGLHNSDPKIAIEFFGDLWHANPKKYNNQDQLLPKHKLSVGEIWLKDQTKIDYLKRQGYQVIIVWESDWETKAGKLNAINQIRKEFGLDSITENDLKDLLRSTTQVNTPQPPTTES